LTVRTLVGVAVFPRVVPMLVAMLMGAFPVVVFEGFVLVTVDVILVSASAWMDVGEVRCVCSGQA